MTLKNNNDFAIDFEKVNQYIFDGDFVTNELIETYEGGSGNSLGLVERQAHEIKNGSTDACRIRMEFINQFINKLIHADTEHEDITFALNCLKKNGFIRKE